MIATCSGCNARYKLDATKVPERQIRVRCPECSTVFELDGTRREAPAAQIPPIEPVSAPSPALETHPAPEMPPVSETTLSETTPAPETTPVTEMAPAADESPAPSGADDLSLEPVSSAATLDTIEPTPATPPAAAEPPASEPPEADEPTDDGPAAADLDMPAPEPATTPAAPKPAPAPAAETEAQPAAGGTATAVAEEAPRSPGRRRRRDKTEMLARALVSDILVYNREIRDKALADGNLLEALGPEIKKSWELYKEKVGAEAASNTSYFKDALNEILAEGAKVF